MPITSDLLSQARNFVIETVNRRRLLFPEPKALLKATDNPQLNEAELFAIAARLSNQHDFAVSIPQSGTVETMTQFVYSYLSKLPKQL